MPISVVCPGCGRRLKAPDVLAGRRLPCPACRAGVDVPAAPVDDAAAALLLGNDEPSEPSPPAPLPDPVPARVVAAPRGPVKPPTPVGQLPPLKSDEAPGWLRHLHWLLVLALIPLGVSLMTAASREDDEKRRWGETIKSLSPEAMERFLRVADSVDEGKADADELFSALPRGRLIGAALSRNTHWHWAFALVSIALFLAFFVFLATGGVAEPKHLVIVGVFTGTIGVLFLVIVQAIASATQGVVVVGGSILVIFFWIAKLIALSYQAALDPDNGFFVSFLGFTAGVGLLEEVVKIAPVVWRYRREGDDNWRGAFLWGLASGAGFGIAEGIMYSGHIYNGISGPGVYVVRFVSCVALHALWTGSAAIAVQQRQHLIQAADRWFDFIAPTLTYIAVPMVLHGLYDTLLKKDYNAWALVVALASFGYLAFQVSRLHGVDSEQATADMLKEYRRRRKAMA